VRLLGRFALVLVVLGLLLGWIVRARWGPRPGRAFWIATFAPVTVHAVAETLRAFSAPIPIGAPLAFALASLALLAVSVLAVRAFLAGKAWRAALVPLGHALAHVVAASLLGGVLSTAAVAPPVVGPAVTAAWALVVSSAWLVVLMGTRGRPRPAGTPGHELAPGAGPPSARLRP
jgi:hypothetical protein